MICRQVFAKTLHTGQGRLAQNSQTHWFNSDLQIDVVAMTAAPKQEVCFESWILQAATSLLPCSHDLPMIKDHLYTSGRVIRDYCMFQITSCGAKLNEASSKILTLPMTPPQLAVKRNATRLSSTTESFETTDSA